MNIFLTFSLLFLISAAGVGLYFFKYINRTWLNMLIAIGAGSMLSVALIHILPEAMGITEYAVYAFLGGFLCIYLIEELLTPHVHDHKHGDHHHEDHHEHYNHVALVSFVAIFIHTLFDGFGIHAGFQLSDTLGYAVLLGVAVHQIPVSLSLAAIFQASKFPRSRQMMAILCFALSAPIGFFIGDAVLVDVTETVSALATACAGGSLLYIASSDLLPIIHEQSYKKYFSIISFLVGVMGMTLVALFE